MERVKRAIGFGVLGLLVGCASSSGVVPVGDNKYMISRSEKGFDTTGSRVKMEAIKEANRYCSSKGKKVDLIEAKHKDMVPFKSDAQATIKFRCVDPE